MTKSFVFILLLFPLFKYAQFQCWTMLSFSTHRVTIIYWEFLRDESRIDEPALHVHARDVCMERRKYISTAFGRILIGGLLSVLCLTAPSFVFLGFWSVGNVIQRVRFTRMYRIIRGITAEEIRYNSKNLRRSKLHAV